MNGADTIRKNIDLLSEQTKTHRTVIEAQLEEAVRCLKGHGPADSADFFRRAFSKEPLCGDFLYISSKLVSSQNIYKKAKEVCQIACTKSPVFYSAVRKLCSFAGTIRILEESDFRACCESVQIGNTDYCILPLSSSVDGYYPTFSKLLKAYDLKICKVISHTRQDSDEELQLALLSRELEIQNGAENISFSFTDGQEDPLSATVSALSDRGIRIKSINSSPLEYSIDSCEHRITAELSGFSPAALLYFLEAALPGHTVLGIY